MGEDVYGYYATLGLEPGASIGAVKEAFRKLAKESHPDRAHVSDGGERFRQISEAYEILSDPESKANYDHASSSERMGQQVDEPVTIDPVTCQVCGKITAQPRWLVFWRVTSFLLASTKTPVQKIYCQSCAMSEQWKSTIWTALLGWWGLPWGPAWSIMHGFTNAFGGTRDSDVDETLMWQNALAFASRGQGDFAIGLGNILRKSENSERAQRSADLIRFFGERGFDASATLKDPWKQSAARAGALLATAFALPSAAIAYAIIASSASTSKAATSSHYDDADLTSGESALGETFGPDAAVGAVTPAEEVPVPTCDTPPPNGEVLTDDRADVERGHVLEIDNGTQGNAVVKLRDAASGKAVASFFIKSGASASLTDIPDGMYRIQYAFGDALAADCHSFAKLASAGEFPDSETFATKYREELDGTTIITGKLSYTLYATPGGNVSPDQIDPAEFNKP